jgi:hypothetical protein
MPAFAKFMALYLLLGSFLPQSDFSQLGKLGRLMEHYELHQELAASEGQRLSFLHYLSIHFIHPDQHEHGEDSHQDLPLQSFHSTLQIVWEADVWLLPRSEQPSRTIFAPLPDCHPHALPFGLLRPPIV